MKLRLLIIFLFSFFNISAQSKNSFLDSVISYKLFNPEKAVLFGLAGIESLNSNENKKIEFEYYYQLGEIFNKLNLYPEAVEFLTRSIDIYDEISLENSSLIQGIEPGWVLINIGNIHFKTNNLESAKAYFLEALEIFQNYHNESLEQKNYGLNTAQNNLALIEIEKGNLEIAKSYLNQILERRLIVGKASDIMYSYFSLMSFEFQNNNFEMGIEYFEKAKNLYAQNTQQEQFSEELALYYSYIQEILGTYFLNKREFKKALDYLLFSEEILKKIENENFNDNINIIHKISETYLEIGDLKNTEFYLSKVEKIYLKIDIDKKIRFNELLAEKFTKQNQTQQLIEAKNAIINLTNQKNLEIQKSNLLSLDTKLLIRKKQKEFELKENNLWRTIYISIIIILLLALTSSILYFSFKYVRVKNSKLILEKEKINSELNYKKRELLSKTNFIVQRNEHLKKLNQNIDSQDLNKRELGEIKREINSMINSEKYYSEFDKLFSEIYPEFSKNLKTKFGLSNTYIRLAAYIKMNQSNNQIAKICGISLRTVESQRYRLSKLLNLQKGQDLNEFLNTF